MRDINLESTIYPRFNTRAFSTGVPTTLLGAPVLSVYEENNLVKITSGVSVAVDYDSVIGLNQVAIVATAANGYEPGKSYDLVIDAGTVDGVSVVGEIVFSFTVDVNVNQIWNRVLTGSTHNVQNSSGKRLRDLQSNVYQNAAIWIDTVNGAPGAVDYENGTMFNPVDNLADATTLSLSLGINKFIILSGSSITLASTYNNYTFTGDNWTIVLGGQDIGGTLFIGASVSGISSGTVRANFNFCHFNGTTLPPLHASQCHFTSIITAASAGSYIFDHCHSAIAGASAPVFDFGGVIGDTDLQLRHYSGGIKIENMGDAGTDVISMEGNGQFIEGTCTGGIVAIRGNISTSGITNLTVAEDARVTTSSISQAVAEYNMGNGRTIEEALAFLRNKWTIAGGILTVYDTDDVSVLWTSVMTQTPGDPVSSSDPG